MLLPLLGISRTVKFPTDTPGIGELHTKPLNIGIEEER
jgi:hypothetical protein